MKPAKTIQQCVLTVVLLLLAEVNTAKTVNHEKSIVKRSDDTSLASLTAVVQQQSAQIQTLTAELTALKNTLPTSFQQVAFTVHFSNDHAGYGVPLTAPAILQFDSAVTNLGQGYDPKTGIFRAPVPGLYAFFLTTMTPNSSGSVHLIIEKHGNILDDIFAEGQGDDYDQGSGQVTTHMSAGEEVYVRIASGDAVRGGPWTVFTGYLIQAD